MTRLLSSVGSAPRGILGEEEKCFFIANSIRDVREEKKLILCRTERWKVSREGGI